MFLTIRSICPIGLSYFALIACSDSATNGLTPDARIDAAAGTVDGSSPSTNPITGIGAVVQLPGSYQFTEGALWFDGKLIFSDVPASKMYQWTVGGAATTIFRDPSGGANGNAVGQASTLYTCEHGGKRIAKTVNGTVTTVVDAYAGAPLNSPNDVIVRNDGNVYFTDPNYAGNTQPKQNVFRVSPQGALNVIDDTLQKPNGIALSPDQTRLYVTSAEGGFINLYDVAADGSTSNRRKFVDVASPDGIAVDNAGNVYVASNRVEVFSAQGANLGFIAVPQQPSNVALGGVTGKTLFITARTAVFQVDVNIAGPS
jgi:gluconolactonase